uniref:Uncharacterized protein n=1 Tax=Lygus hesperus TaxID=30085 RepID=A0A146KSI7_LYGHE
MEQVYTTRPAGSNVRLVILAFSILVFFQQFTPIAWHVDALLQPPIEHASQTLPLHALLAQTQQVVPCLLAPSHHLPSTVRFATTLEDGATHVNSLTVPQPHLTFICTLFRP